MRRKKRVRLFFVALALLIGLSVPMPVSAANLYFTAINDSVAPLSADTMPFWSGGTLYVPYSVFDGGLNGVGVGLGLYTSYNRDSGTVTLFNLRQMLIFDLNSGTCRDDVTGTTYSSRAILRSGRPYLALNMVCSHFNLEYSYSQLPNVPQGYLVRVKGAGAVMSDADFIEVARNVINNRLREYTKGLNSAESTDPVTPPVTSTEPARPTVAGKDDVETYLAFRCESGEGATAIMNALSGSGYWTVFFLTPQLLEEEGDLARRILGAGHSIGIWAEGNQAALALEQGGLALEKAACARTTLAYVPAGQREGLEERGWVCWKETVLLQPDDTVNSNAFASGAVKRLGNRNSTVYLTLEGGENTARVLPTLLRYLSNENYIVSVPIETKL